MSAPSYDESDPFDLPTWLGECEVTWETVGGLSAGHLVAGQLTAPDQAPLACDLLAVDDAYPTPVAPEATRVRAHQVWRHGEVLLATERGTVERRLLLVVPGSRLDAETILDAVGRLARAVGAKPGSYAVHLKVGA